MIGEWISEFPGNQRCLPTVINKTFLSGNKNVKWDFWCLLHRLRVHVFSAAWLLRRKEARILSMDVQKSTKKILPICFVNNKKRRALISNEEEWTIFYETYAFKIIEWINYCIKRFIGNANCCRKQNSFKTRSHRKSMYRKDCLHDPNDRRTCNLESSKA